jgi:pimeloyl-ACP methyl ester carboxylesterase
MLVKYTPVIARHFQAQPLFLPLKVTPVEDGESVEFSSADGLRLSGTYFRSRTLQQCGVIVYCHEYLSDRWSFRPYIDGLRDLGFDIFSFDFRNHGSSKTEAAYAPMQWATDREVLDLKGALAYLRTRADRDPAGLGLFGVSRGGTTALLTAADEPDVWGVATDGAFPTSGTMLTYILRWAEIYVTSGIVRNAVPRWLYRLLAWSGRRRTERSLNCRFPSVERAAARIWPRPWLLIHGQADTYISPEIALGLFHRGKDPKEIWLVSGAKHNRCLERNPEAYAARVYDFFERIGPRRPVPAAVELGVATTAALADRYSHPLAPAELAREIVSPISG